MSDMIKLAVVSDIHYASATEQARGDDFEFRDIPNPRLQFFLRNHRRFFWLHRPFRQNHLLDRFLAQATDTDFVVANGDFSCDSAFVGVSDDAACESASECLAKLRGKFGGNFRATIGDHELGKLSFVMARGGMRLESYRRSREELGIERFWKMELGRYVLIGVTSSLIAFPVLEPDTLPEERQEWNRLREEHLGEIRTAFSALKPDQRVLLFCHDPTALPFLAREEAIRNRLAHVELTTIGHLHSKLILWQSRFLAGMPVIGFLGHSGKRLSTALREASDWKPFRVSLCPALAGIELLKDGGFLMMEIDPGASSPVRISLKRIRR